MYGDAKPLKKVMIVGVISSSHPEWEEINSNITQTKCQHESPQICIQTAEIVYGAKKTTRLNGLLLDLARYAVPITDNSNHIAYYKIWNTCNHHNGHSQYKNPSITAPSNSYSTTTNIIQVGSSFGRSIYREVKRDCLQNTGKTGGNYL